MRLNSTYIWLICAPLFVSAMDSYAFTTVAMTKGNPRATMFIASGYGTQQEADDAAVSGCKAILQARGWNSIDSANTRCDELKRQPRPGFGAIACNGASSCSTGYGSTEQAAREAALNSCAALFTQTNGGSAYKCSLGTKLGQREIEIAGLWLDDNKPSVQRQAGQGTASAPPAATTGQNSAPSPAQPSGSLKLLCQMQTGQSYIFVIDERTQQVSVRNSTGQDWAIFRNGQLTRQQMGDKAIAMVDSVRVDPAAIRALREPRDDLSGSAPPNVSSDRQTNEFAGLLVTLAGVVVTTSSVVIDRNQSKGSASQYISKGAIRCKSDADPFDSTWPNGADLDPLWVHEEIGKNNTWSELTRLSQTVQFSTSRLASSNATGLTSQSKRYRSRFVLINGAFPLACAAK